MVENEENSSLTHIDMILTVQQSKTKDKIR